MEINKFKKIFILVSIILVILIILTNCSNDNENNKEPQKSNNVNVESVHSFENLDYNNLSDIEKSYIRDKYLNKVEFTNEGVIVYFEDVSSGKISKIITSSWPEEKLGVIMPEADYGELDRIEYAENWCNIYIKNAKKNNVKDYLKKLKKYNFNKQETKIDNDIMIEYKVYNENNDYVRIRFFKKNKKLEIYAKF